jgi:hypothetical protein
MSVKKYMLGFCLASLAAVQPSSAIGVAVGPSLGLAGYYASFDAQDKHKVVIGNYALQVGGFMKLDLWLLYAKVDPLFVLDWRRLPNKVDKDCFKNITIPITIGVPLFSLLRPHVGVVVRMHLSSDNQFKGNAIIEKYKEKINSWLFGIGVDLGNFLLDLDFEWGMSSITRKSVDPLLLDGDKDYTPKQFALKIGYNLLGLMQ